MTTLQQSKIILEDQIAFKKDAIAKKKQLFDQLEGSAANEMQLEIEALIVEQWQDEAVLKAVNEEISRIPTLAYQKVLTTIVAVFICLSAFSQAFIGGEATNHGVGMNAGYMLNKVQLQIGVHAPITSDKDKPFAGYGSVGYQISINDFSIIPAIGIAKYNTTDFSTDGGIEINKTVLFPSLEIGKESVAISGIKFRYYLFVDHAVKTFVGAGLKFFIQ